MLPVTRIRFVIAALAVVVLSACAKDDLTGPPEPMGQFRLGHNIVVADNAQLGPLSRKATPDEWETSLTAAIDQRLGNQRYNGEKLYHLGVAVDGYALALPGVPMVATPKSVLVVSVTVWDNAAGGKINEKPKQLTAFENAPQKTFFFGSGLTQTKAEQMENLSRSAAKAIHKWLLENKAWFGADPETADEMAAEVVAEAN